jgi:hypothetical protein
MPYGKMIRCCIRSRCCFAFVAVLTFVIVASAQNIPMKVQHPTSPTTELEVKAMLPEDFPAIDKTAFAKVHPASFVLTNLSNRAIVALVVEWSYTAQDGHEGRGFVKSSATVQPNTRLFVGPKVFLPEALAFAPHIGSPFEALDGRSGHWAATASQITATIDVVVFEDGELVGPDQSQFEVEMQSQKMAADQIASKVRRAQAQGQDPTPMLKQIAEAPMESTTDFIGLWSGLYAHQLLSARGSSRVDARLTAMEKTPTPLKIFRKTQ